MRNKNITLLFFLSIFIVSLHGAELPSIQEKTKGMKPYEGFMDFYWNDATGEIFMKIDERTSVQSSPSKQAVFENLGDFEKSSGTMFLSHTLIFSRPRGVFLP